MYAALKAEYSAIKLATQKYIDSLNSTRNVSVWIQSEPKSVLIEFKQGKEILRANQTLN